MKGTFKDGKFERKDDQTWLLYGHGCIFFILVRISLGTTKDVAVAK
jgi:hypothetical protein